MLARMPSSSVFAVATALLLVIVSMLTSKKASSKTKPKLLVLLGANQRLGSKAFHRHGGSKGQNAQEKHTLFTIFSWVRHTAR